MTDVMKIGVSGLLAYQRQITTIGNNVANATTPGYSRQRVDLESVSGGGVIAARLTRLADSLNLAKSVDSNGEIGRLSQLATYSSQIDKLISDPSTGLSSQWSGFFSAAQDMVNSPTSSVSRSQMLTAGQQLATRWNSIDRQLGEVEADVNTKLSAKVENANQLMAEVAELNRQIVSGGSTPSAELMDRRALKMGELANLVGGSVVDQGDGNLNLFTDSGIAMVLGTRTMKLTTTTDPYTSGRLNIAMETPSGVVPLPAKAITGEVGGLIEFRSTVLDPARAELDRQAFAFATAFNAQHAGGVDYNGELGGAFFSFSGPKAIANPNNTGTGAVGIEVADIGGLQGFDIEVKFDGSAWTAARADTGEAVAMTGAGTAADPFVVGGMKLTMPAGAAGGDKFLLSPTHGAASSLQVAITDPNKIAAASPISVSLGAGNSGPVTGGTTEITDHAAFASFAGASIVFTSPTTYTIDGGAPITYTPGDAITGPGWSFKPNGVPAAGDSFGLSATGSRSSSNGNALVFAELDDKGILSGGSLSISAALNQLTARTGSMAQLNDLNHKAQLALDKEINAERESLSGVNLDEEASNLMNFQQAYSAAAQVINVADEMFQTVLAAVRN